MGSKDIWKLIKMISYWIPPPKSVCPLHFLKRFLNAKRVTVNLNALLSVKKIFFFVADTSQVLNTSGYHIVQVQAVQRITHGIKF